MDTPLEGWTIMDTPPEGWTIMDTPLEGWTIMDTPLEGWTIMDTPLEGWTIIAWSFNIVHGQLGLHTHARATVDAHMHTAARVCRVCMHLFILINVTA